MKDKFILYISGGTMEGVFGAGVVTALQEMNIYDRVEAIYGASAGTITAAYFSTKQSRLGSSIFYDDLTHDFISIHDFWFGVWDRLEAGLNNVKSHDHFRDAFNVDYLLKVITQTKVLNTGVLINQPIPIYTKLLNLKNKQTEYFDIRKGDTMVLLRASVLLAPYVHEVYRLGGSEYVDAALVEPLGIGRIIDRHPRQKIVVVLNQPILRKFRHKLKNMIEGKIMSYMYDDTFYPLVAGVEDKLRDELKLIKENPNIILLHPDKNSPTRTRTTNVNKLFTTYQQGIDAGELLVA